MCECDFEIEGWGGVGGVLHYLFSLEKSLEKIFLTFELWPKVIKNHNHLTD